MTVRLGEEGLSLYAQGGYGRPDKGGLRLEAEEALYLVHRGRIEVPGCTFESLLSSFSTERGFVRRYLVYRDIRERGYVVQAGPHDFRVFRRGQRPGSGRSQYLVRVLSERDLVNFEAMSAEATASLHMRKQHVLAVVDDENELTYYELKLQKLTPAAEPPALPPATAPLFSTFAIVETEDRSPLEDAFFGKRLDPERLILSPVETLYLLEKGMLALHADGASIPAGEYLRIAGATDVELAEKAKVYADLRERGYVPRTGYKFGHHFRVYIGKKTHSDLLVHAIPAGTALPMSTISRSVRLAHSVKKKMLFAYVHNTIEYLEFARIKL